MGGQVAEREYCDRGNMHTEMPIRSTIFKSEALQAVLKQLSIVSAKS